MTTAVLAPLADTRPADGGAPARRAVVRWAWRLFRREWRQQFLILALIVVAVAATIVGSSVATNTPPPNNSGFGTAADSATFSSSNAHVKSEIADLEHRFGRVEVIENETMSIPGSINTFQLRAQDPHGPFSGPMLALVSGRYPAGADEVAVTSGVASAFHLKVGDTWRVGGAERRVVGIVENPQSLLDEFALVPPGQLKSPTQVTALFDAPGVPPGSIKIGTEVQTPASVAQSNPLNPETISLAALVLGMLLIALVSVGGFTVLAQRRLRSIGMLESIGATDRHVRLVVRRERRGRRSRRCGRSASCSALVVWLAYRPSLEQSAHHVIGVFALPWVVVAAAMVLVGRRGVLRRVPTRRARSPGCRSSPRSRVARPRPARSTARRSPASSSSSRPSCSSATREARAEATGAVVRQSWCSGSCSSSPASSCSHPSSSRSPRGWPGARRSRPDWRCATSPVTGHARARRSRRSASASSSRSSSCSPPPRATATSSTTRGRTLPRTSSGSTPTRRHRRARRSSDRTGSNHVQQGSSTSTTATPQQLATHAEAIAKGLGAQLIALETPRCRSRARPKAVGTGTERSTSRPRSCCGRSGSRRPRSIRTRTS